MHDNDILFHKLTNPLMPVICSQLVIQSHLLFALSFTWLLICSLGDGCFMHLPSAVKSLTFCLVPFMTEKRSDKVLICVTVPRASEELFSLVSVVHLHVSQC